MLTSVEHRQVFTGEFADTDIYAMLDVEWTTRDAIDGR